MINSTADSTADPGSFEDPYMLAVDIGIRSGFAWFDRKGKVTAFRSQNFGSVSRLRKAIPQILHQNGSRPDWLILEGGGTLFEHWKREAERFEIKVLRVDAESWREGTLYGREMRSGKKAKKYAIAYAEHVLSWSGQKSKGTLRHDTAEAILVGFWALREINWVDDLPDIHRAP